MVAAVQSKGRDKYLLIDSGACENVAKQGEFDADVDPIKSEAFVQCARPSVASVWETIPPKCR